ncbi:MAG: exonuclease domain-containing protein [Woeseiaceae bacterium]|nr:exonuclease domain-containing protein [Woeseiaceae bacterium]
MRHRSLLLKRWLARRRMAEPPMSRLVNEPAPSPSEPFRRVEFVSLDIETTGLDAGTADMLSVGWVLVRNGKVDLETAETYIVRPSGDVGDSASVHGLTDTMVEAGHDWIVVLNKIIEVLTGRVLLVHHAGLDKALLDRMCRQVYGARLLVPVVDTLALELRRQERRHHVNDRQSLKLGDLRDTYNLPRYGAHDCLVDAIATAELLIAMVAHNDGSEKTRLGDLQS